MTTSVFLTLLISFFTNSKSACASLAVLGCIFQFAIINFFGIILFIVYCFLIKVPPHPPNDSHYYYHADCQIKFMKINFKPVPILTGYQTGVSQKKRPKQRTQQSINAKLFKIHARVPG